MSQLWIFDWLGPGNYTSSGVVTYALLLLMTWLSYKALEPLMSPLRKIPGMSYNPLIGNMPFLMAGQAMDATCKMVKRFGPLSRFYFMFGRERLLVADPDILKHVFVTNARNYVKPPERLRLMWELLGNGLVTSEGDIHAVHKRLISPAFNSQSITKMIPIFESRVRKLVEIWSRSIPADGGSALLPVHADLARATLDIIGLTAFSYDFKSLDNPDHEICVAFQSMLTGLGLSWRIALPFYTNLPVPEMRRIWKNIHIMDKVVNNIIADRRKLISTGKDLDLATADVLGKMMIARDDETGQSMTDSDLRDHVMTLMLAGHETTAVTMSWCLLMLATHQQIQDKARSEILSIVDPSVELSHDVIDKLEYCGCVIKETLRLLPAVPMTLRKSLKDDIFPGDYFVPAGTTMNLSMGPMMRREELYSDPESFIPERFLQKDSETDVYKFAPFIYGPRQCLGYRFALVEMRVMLAVLLRSLRFDLDPEGPQYKRQMTITMRPSPSLKLRVSHFIDE